MNISDIINRYWNRFGISIFIVSVDVGFLSFITYGTEFNLSNNPNSFVWYFNLIFLIFISFILLAVLHIKVSIELSPKRAMGYFVLYMVVQPDFLTNFSVFEKGLLIQLIRVYFPLMYFFLAFIGIPLIYRNRMEDWDDYQKSIQFLRYIGRYGALLSPNRSKLPYFVNLAFQKLTILPSDWLLHLPESTLFVSLSNNPIEDLNISQDVIKEFRQSNTTSHLIIEVFNTKLKVTEEYLDQLYPPIILLQNESVIVNFIKKHELSTQILYLMQEIMGVNNPFVENLL